SGQGGFPGPIHVQVRYWVAGTVVGHEITATTERPTVANIVSHVYFNLSGRLQPMNKPDPASRHELTVAAARHLPVTRQLIPLPEAPAPVSGELDLRSARPLDEVVSGAHPQIQLLHGVDHAFVLDQPSRGPAATLSHPASGRTVSIETDYPAIQIYTGQAIEDACLTRPEGQAAPFVAVAIETEGYPDAPNRPDFPGTTLRPGETYRQTTTWHFTLS
ncbi:MAG: hypothetical protein LBS56_07825, partial [Propionibacteriaceae bacterium]|nr:hypothetical protein [Propionibacteriaceae bacterium]